jgi:cytochrome c biogenesis protein CcdA
MRVELSIGLALIFLTLGYLLVCDTNASSDYIQSTRILGGALFLALGIAVPLAMKRRRKARRIQKMSFRTPFGF